jgi:O-antigen/teichoic acid export membrane protein
VTYYTRANKNTLLGIAATGLSVIITAVIMPMIVVRFGSDNWARYSFFLLYVAILAFIESSLQIYVSQRTATAHARTTIYSWKRDNKILYALLATFVAASLIIGFSLTHELTQDVNLQYMLALAFVNVFPRTISSVIKGAMQGLNSQARYYSVTTLLNLSRPLFLLLVLLVFKPQILSLVIAYVIFSYAEMTAYLLLNASPLETQSQAAKPSATDSKILSSLLMSNCLSVVAANLDKILIFISVSLTLASTYTFAATMAGLLYLYVNAAIASFGPKFRELYLNNDQATLGQYLYGISFINNTLIMLAIAVFYFVGSDLLQPLASKLDVHNVINTFLYLSAASLLASNLWIPGAMATSSMLTSFNVKTNLLFMATYLISFYKIFPESDQFIFAKSMLVAAAVTSTFGMAYFKLKIFDVNMKRYALLAIVFPALLVSLLSMPLWWIDEIFKSFWVNLAYLFLIAAAFIGVWFWLGNRLQKHFIALSSI